MDISEYISILEQGNDALFQHAVGLTKAEFQTLLNDFEKYEDSTRKLDSAKKKLHAILLFKRWGLARDQVGSLLLNSSKNNALRDGKTFVENVGRRLNNTLRRSPNEIKEKVLCKSLVKFTTLDSIINDFDKKETTSPSSNDNNERPPIIVSKKLSKPKPIAPKVPDKFDIGLENYLIVSAPIASSGDIYHVAALLFLLRAYELQIPRVILTYDTAPQDSKKEIIPSNVKDVKTYHHAEQRSATFLNGLGFGEQCTVHQIENKSAFYQCRREEVLANFLCEQYPDTPYIDQRASTSLVVWHMKKVGFDKSTEIIRNGMSKWSAQGYFNTAEVNRINAYGKHVYNEIQKKYNVQPFIVMHIRKSSGQGANKEQVLPADFEPSVSRYLEDNKIGVVIVYADSRIVGNKGYKNYLSFKPFSGKHTDKILQKHNPTNTNNDLAKFFHLELLLRIYQLKNCKGIVGNTSGTLDVAAFLGHKVFNIHVFDQLPHIDYQDYRLLMQMVFLAVQSCNEWVSLSARSRRASPSRDLLSNLLAWILQGTQPSLSQQFVNTRNDLSCFSTINFSGRQENANRISTFSFWSELQDSVAKEVDFQDGVTNGKEEVFDSEDEDSCSTTLSYSTD